MAMLQRLFTRGTPQDRIDGAVDHQALHETNAALRERSVAVLKRLEYRKQKLREEHAARRAAAAKAAPQHDTPEALPAVEVEEDTQPAVQQHSHEEYLQADRRPDMHDDGAQGDFTQEMPSGGSHETAAPDTFASGTYEAAGAELSGHDMMPAGDDATAGDALGHAGAAEAGADSQDDFHRDFQGAFDDALARSTSTPAYGPEHETEDDAGDGAGGFEAAPDETAEPEETAGDNSLDANAEPEGPQRIRAEDLFTDDTPLRADAMRPAAILPDHGDDAASQGRAGENRDMDTETAEQLRRKAEEARQRIAKRLKANEANRVDFGADVPPIYHHED